MKKLKHIFYVPVLCFFLFYTNAQAQNTNYTVKHDTCLNKKFSIVFYLIQDSTNSLPGTASSYSLADIVNELNTAFSRICVSFENCKTVIIPNNEYNEWKIGITDSVVMTNWYYPNTINFYIPAPASASIVGTDLGSLYTYGSALPLGNVPTKDYIVMQKEKLGTSLLHTFGHFFGLEHTYAELSAASPTVPSQELADGSNSSTHGDRISDTNADCYPNGFEFTPPAPPASPQPCAFDYSSGLKDAAGNYYSPPVDNLMSNYFECRCRFTQEQYNRMAYIILTRRLYLH
ncbi:MAG: hypothetical protein KF900_01555 [Bacteroidetes bacterium]|nr:hypothetical protein [Bacteroidota bacterium]